MLVTRYLRRRRSNPEVEKRSIRGVENPAWRPIRRLPMLILRQLKKLVRRDWNSGSSLDSVSLHPSRLVRPVERHTGCTPFGASST